MKQLLITLMVFFMTPIFAQNNQETHVRSFLTNHIIIIDKTGSMIGKAGGTDIWKQVQTAIKDYVSSVELNDKITIYTYAESISSPKVFKIKTESDKQFVNNFISVIKADGKNTCTYKALKKVIDEYNEDNGMHSNLIYLYTDGINNCSDYTMQQVANTFNAKRDDYDYLYYITLGQTLPADVMKVADNNKNIITQSVANPHNKEEILPKTLKPVKEVLVFDFTQKNNEITQKMPFKVNGNINFPVKLSCEIQKDNLLGVELITKEVELKDNSASFKIKIDEDTFFKNDLETEIKLFVTKGNVSLIFNTFKIKLILPKKGKSTIKFE